MNIIQRIMDEGTLGYPSNKLNPEFALPSSTNWIRALTIYVKSNDVNFETCLDFYGKTRIKFRNPSVAEENSIFEQLSFSIHYVSALRSLNEAVRELGQQKNSDFSRLAILSWYYGQYSAAIAMIISHSGMLPTNHMKSAISWASYFVSGNQLAISPFDVFVPSLVKKELEDNVVRLYGGNYKSHKMHHTPTNDMEAGCILAQYLKGSVEWYRNRAESNIRDSPDFKSLNVDNFRTKKARHVRDRVLRQKHVGYIHQLYRFRSKANYRDALYLALKYDRFRDINTNELDSFIIDLASVLEAFVGMAGAFICTKIGEKRWRLLVASIERDKAFSMNVKEIWD